MTGIYMCRSPSCVGVGVLQHVYGRRDSELVDILKKSHAVIFGKTNVPEFACSGATLNHANGVCRNPLNSLWSTGGSSGGSASATSARIGTISVTEDTGEHMQSTRALGYVLKVIGFARWLNSKSGKPVWELRL